MPEIATAVSITVAVMSAVIAIATYVRGGKQVVQGDAAERAEMSLKLEFISNDLKDIKAEDRRRVSELREVREQHVTDINELRGLIIIAQEHADAAHDRLDRAGIDMRRVEVRHIED